MITVWLRTSSTVVSQVACNVLETTLEADSHFDTTCLGGRVLKLYGYNFPVNVQGYDTSLGVKQYSTVSGAFTYVNPFTGLKYHLIVHQAIHMPDLGHHLLCPMQCRVNGVVINECPRMYCREPTQESHAIVVMDKNGASVVLPFFLRGVTSNLNRSKGKYVRRKSSAISQLTKIPSYVGTGNIHVEINAKIGSNHGLIQSQPHAPPTAPFLLCLLSNK